MNIFTEDQGTVTLWRGFVSFHHVYQAHERWIQVLRFDNAVWCFAFTAVLGFCPDLIKCWGSFR